MQDDDSRMASPFSLLNSQHRHIMHAQHQSWRAVLLWGCSLSISCMLDRLGQNRQVCLDVQST